MAMSTQTVKKIAILFCLLLFVVATFAGGMSTSYYVIKNDPEAYLTLPDPNLPVPIIGPPGKMFKARYGVICSADPEFMLNDLKSKGYELTSIFVDGNSSEEKFMFNQIWINREKKEAFVQQMINNNILCLLAFGHNYVEKEDLRKRS